MNPLRLLRLFAAIPSLLCLSTFLSSYAFAQTTPSPDDIWPRFRGPNGSGLMESANLPAEWTDADYKWKIDLPGIGHGSPVVWGDRIFLLCADEATNDRLPVCVSTADGKILWSHTHQTGKFKGHRFNSPASTTPCVDEQRVYFTWGTAESLTVIAFTHEGEKVWEVDLGPVVGGHGFAASPMIQGDLLVLNNDQEKENGFLIALDKATGEQKWKVSRKSQRISYSVPVAYNPTGNQDLLVFTNWTHGFTAIDPADGSVVAEKSVFDTSTNERAISSPIVAGDIVVGTCGFTGYPKHCVAMKLNGADWQELWRVEKSVPHIPSPIIVGDLIFLWDDAGVVTCLEYATGEQLWRARAESEGEFFGSPVSDGEKIFSIDKEGNVSVIAASREFEQLAFNRLGELCRTTPAIADGDLYLRTFSKLYAVKGR